MKTTLKNTMWKLHNPIKNYDWGTINELSKCLNIANPNQKPLAEVWMGTHRAGVSVAIDAKNEKIKLNQLIAQNPIEILGEQTANKYLSLPYLFKILSAKEALSIQVHPKLSKAKIGFERENLTGIALDSLKRNYKDPNHKPELIYALTPFWAMNGFRPIDEIITLFSKLDISVINHQVRALAHNPSHAGLKQFFRYILALEGDLKQQALTALKTVLKTEITTLHNEIPFNIIKQIAKTYPNDNGLFSPLILNVIELNPGQAMFIKAQTPHAYLKGTGLEIMASSDNVLRAGLTNKHIDIDELLDNTTFDSISAKALLTCPIKDHNKTRFPVPVNDFAFEIIESTQKFPITQTINSAEIILCIKGEVTVSTPTDSYTLKTGESVFIACSAKQFNYQGKGTLARAFNH